MVVLLLAIMPTVVAHNIDPLWENTMGPGNQGEKAFAATGDPWDLAVAADFLGYSPSAARVNGVPIYLNSYSNGPWRISFLDYGTASYQSWPDPLTVPGISVWHSQIYPVSGGIVDVYIIYCSASISPETVAAGIINACGQRQYTSFANLGTNCGLLLLTDDVNAYNRIGSSIQVI